MFFCRLQRYGNVRDDRETKERKVKSKGNELRKGKKGTSISRPAVLVGNGGDGTERRVGLGKASRARISS